MTACSRSFAGDEATSAPPPITPQSRQISNEGVVCFEKAGNLSDVKGYSMTECLSLCSTHIASASLAAVVDIAKRTMRFDTKFVLESEPRDPNQSCLTVCGYGRVEFSISDVDAGTYSIWLGGREIGNLTVPLEEAVCLGGR
jgi:hypothetical protein